MPVFFGFISWTLPSGLVIYFLTGNIFRIGQQALIIRIEDKNETNEKQEKQEKQKEQVEDEEETNQEQDPRKNRKKRRRK
jgi:membrane protein insertase Oxa1/YidC/SpoIIIJ